MRILYALYFPISLLIFTLLLSIYYPVFYIGVIAYLVDIYHRTKEYIKLLHVKQTNMRRKANARIYETYKTSRCQRNVVMAVYPAAKDYYKQLGYRWYHLFPDEWYVFPYCFSPRWWRRFVGV